MIKPHRANAVLFVGTIKLLEKKYAMMGTLTVQQDAFLTALSQQRDGLAQEEMFHQGVLAKHQELMRQLHKSQI